MSSELEEIDYELQNAIDLLTLLGNHFETKRDENVILDYYSIKKDLNEYTTLYYTIRDKLNKVNEKLAKLIKKELKEDK